MILANNIVMLIMDVVLVGVSVTAILIYHGH